ncbi:hypothetical protein [Labilithrix luteola]|uniref:hypothetical protein n=1 Tax=Labilithrix luteola TaxID=1391654 RepID=UPI0014733A7A|nr:hypothetical protein [Labilithrix luteola]
MVFDAARALPKTLEAVRHAAAWGVIGTWTKLALRWLSVHTGLPALFVAAILVVVSYRLLKRSAKFALEVAAVAIALVAATELGWIHW